MSKADPARVFSALGDPIRLELLSRLAGSGEAALGRLVADCGVSRQGATKHLRVLEAAGLVQSRPRGRERFFRVAPGGLASAQDHLDRIARGWDDALARLRDHVERGNPSGGQSHD